MLRVQLDADATARLSIAVGSGKSDMRRSKPCTAINDGLADGGATVQHRVISSYSSSGQIAGRSSWQPAVSTSVRASVGLSCPNGTFGADSQL